MLKFHTKDKEVILKDNTVDLIEDGFTETYNKIIFTDNLAVSEKVITFLYRRMENSLIKYYKIEF